MNNQTITFKENATSAVKICTHLYACNNDFSPKLSENVDIENYAEKIFQNSITFEAWSDEDLVGLVAAYLNDPNRSSGFITNVSVINYFSGQGIASKLINMCIEKASFLKFDYLVLEVSKSSLRAIDLYKRCGFYESEDDGSSIFMKYDIAVR